MIEKFWEDITIYYVKFTSYDELNRLNNHQRVFAFRGEISEKDVRVLVKSRLHNIASITIVDEMDEGLLLKDKVFIE